MKTFRMFGAAVMACALSFCMVSCGDEEETIVLDSTIQKTIVDDVLANTTDKLDAISENFMAFQVKGDVMPVSKIVLNGEKAILLKDVATRAMTDNSIVCGYTMQGMNIVIDAPEPLGKITISMGDVMEIAMQGMTANVEQMNVPAAAGTNEVNICRTWTKPSYRAAVYFDKLPIYGAKDAEKAATTKIKELTTRVMNKLISEKGLTDQGFNLLSSDIVSVSILPNNTLYVVYENGNVEESAWTWKNKDAGTIETTIDDVKVAIDVRCKKGTPNTAYFVIDANVTGVGGLGVHTLSGRLICTMTD